MNLNNITIAGRTTKDPELRYTPDGTPVATVTIAINRPFKNSNNEYDADFINVVIWRKPAETFANYVKKGDEVGGTGRIQSRSYDGQDGKRVYVTEVVLDSFSFGQKAGGNSASNDRGNTNTGGNQQNRATGQNGGFTRVGDDPFAGNGQIDIKDDDLPF